MFKNARIILDEFSIQLHSADSFAPVGVLHPLKFHLEPKSDAWAPDSCSAIMCDDVSNMPASTESVAQSASDAPGPSLEGITLGESQPKGVSVLVNRQQHGFVVLSCSRLSDEDATQGTSQNFIWFQLLRLVSAGRTGVASVANKMMNRLIFRMSADIVAHSTCYGFFGSGIVDLVLNSE